MRPDMNKDIKPYTLSILVQDIPGVLSQVARLFSRKGYNIESIVSGESGDPGVTRITIVLLGDELMISQIAIIALWTMDSGRFSWRIAAPLLADGLFLVGLLIAGMGRANADNTYYVTLRQCAAMIQLILCGWLLCYPLYPRTSESEMD